MEKKKELITATKVREAMGLWQGNNLQEDTLTIKQISIKYGVTEAQARQMVRFKGPYKKFITPDVESIIKKILKVDSRSVAKIENDYLKELKELMKNDHTQEVLDANSINTHDFLLLYVKAFVNKYVHVFEDDYKSKGLSSSTIQEALEYSLNNGLIDIKTIIVTADGSYSGESLCVMYKRMVDNIITIYPDKEPIEAEQDIIRYAIMEIPWILRKPEDRWNGVVRQFIRKDRGYDWYTGKKTQIFNQWIFKPELEQLLDLESQFE